MLVFYFFKMINYFFMLILIFQEFDFDNHEIAIRKHSHWSFFLFFLRYQCFWKRIWIIFWSDLVCTKLFFFSSDDEILLGQFHFVLFRFKWYAHFNFEILDNNTCAICHQAYRNIANENRENISIAIYCLHEFWRSMLSSLS